MFVVRRVRSSASVIPSRCTVSVSSRPSRMDAATPGWSQNRRGRARVARRGSTTRSPSPHGRSKASKPSSLPRDTGGLDPIRGAQFANRLGQVVLHGPFRQVQRSRDGRARCTGARRGSPIAPGRAARPRPSSAATRRRRTRPAGCQRHPPGTGQTHPTGASSAARPPRRDRRGTRFAPKTLRGPAPTGRRLTTGSRSPGRVDAVDAPEIGFPASSTWCPFRRTGRVRSRSRIERGHAD